MKARNAVRVSAVFLGIGAAALLLPATSRAQAEVSPDVYPNESPAATMVAAKPAVTASAKVDAKYQGSFSLPYAVECSGRTLEAGEYTVSLPQGDAFGRVTLRHNGRVVELQPRAISRDGISGQSALLVTQSNGRRTLQAIYVQDRHVTVYFHSDALLDAVNHSNAQRVPIS